MKTTTYPSRKNIRLKFYDYSLQGYYFTTICTFNRKCIFGEINNDTIKLNQLGKSIDAAWRNIKNIYSTVELDKHVVMPNHIHGIIIIHKRDSKELSYIINRYKRFTTLIYRELIERLKLRKFNKQLWQRGYYEHVIRNDKSLYEIQEYIINNPLKWQLDKENPANFK